MTVSINGDGVKCIRFDLEIFDRVEVELIKLKGKKRNRKKKVEEEGGGIQAYPVL